MRPVALAAGTIVAAASTARATPAAITNMVMGPVQYSASLFQRMLQVRNQRLDRMFDRI